MAVEATGRQAARIDRLATRAAADRRAIAADGALRLTPPSPERALEYLRDGVGPAIGCYIEARTGDDLVVFDPADQDHLRGAVNDWLACYTRCYGVALDPDFPLRTVASVLLDTHDLDDTARLLTGVPERTEPV